MELEAHKADNIWKLTAGLPSIERHLFVWIDSRNYRPWKDLVWGIPPLTPPTVPEEVTHLCFLLIFRLVHSNNLLVADS